MIDNIKFLAMNDITGFILVQILTAMLSSLIIIQVNTLLKNKGKKIDPKTLFAVAALIQILSTYFLASYIGKQSRIMLDDKRIICSYIKDSTFDPSSRYCYIPVTVDGKSVKARIKNYYLMESK